MRIYLAGEREPLKNNSDTLNAWATHTRRRLFSYFYHGAQAGNKPSKDIIDTAATDIDMFCDSGAFTAFTKSVNIDIDKYAEFINNTSKMWNAISNLDDTSKNEQKSWDNQKALESLGCKIQPVFHAREDESWLIKYLDTGYDYIFIGGMVPESTAWLKEWLDHLWSNYLTNPDGTPRIKVHGFGLTSQNLMSRYPWYSVDSTSWLNTGIFGACAFYIDGKMIKVFFTSESPAKNKLTGWHYDMLPQIGKLKIKKLLESLGYTVEQCRDNYRIRDAVNAHTYQNLEQYGIDKFIKEQETFF